MYCADRHCLARHPIHHTTGFILRDIECAGFAHLQHAGRAILAHAGQDHTQRILAGIDGSRFEQHIDRRSVTIHGRPLVKRGHIVGAAASEQ